MACNILNIELPSGEKTKNSNFGYTNTDTLCLGRFHSDGQLSQYNKFLPSYLKHIFGTNKKHRHRLSDRSREREREREFQ